MVASGLADEIECRGFALADSRVDSHLLNRTREFFSQRCASTAMRKGSLFGARNLFEFEEIRTLSRSPGLREIVETVIGQNARAVRALYFDKTNDANWPVPWHQDLTLAVDGPRDRPGWAAWTIKAGMPHARAPDSLLERMLTLRIHLDDCGPSNGPVRVLVGTHVYGRVPQEKIPSLRETHEERLCVAQEGEVLVMRPLLLHASSPAERPAHRRVIHLEFAPADILSDGFRWAAAV